MRARAPALAFLAAACCGRAAPIPPAVGLAAPTPDAAAIAQLLLSPAGACGVFVDGAARCWGEWGGDLIRVAAPATGLTGVAELRAGHDVLADPQRFFDHLCARDTHGAVRCWGNDRQGQLGAPAVRLDDGSMTPERVDGLADARQLALGARHACARTGAGDVWCWGQNRYGQAGAGSGTELVRRATRVAGVDGALELIATHESTCARTAAAVLCWGQNQNGQADPDDPRTAVRWTPGEVAAGQGAVELAAGDSAVCARDAAGAVRCWGFVRDLLGEAFAARSEGPVAGLPPATAIAVGDSHACAVVEGGAVWCWGQDALGQQGGGVRHPGWSAPAVVPLPAAAERIVAAGDDTCARLIDRRWICWGANLHGQLAAHGSPLAPTVLDLGAVDLAAQ